MIEIKLLCPVNEAVSLPVFAIPDLPLGSLGLDEELYQ